ncbi:DNA polymerase [Thiohalocapsa phage LS06-2018-MD03]|nr:DNA polymerase [Thiohalocapsa phage LS06-2018-MD03]
MKILTFDIETYFNYSLFAFRDVANDNKLTTFEIRGKNNTLSDKKIKKMHKMLTTHQIITYNGLKFDEPITAFALKQKTAHEIYIKANELIKDKNRSVYQFYRSMHAEPFIKNHIDIMDVARGSASLKLYGARLGAKKLQDLPYKPETKLSDKQMDDVLAYCENDNKLTQLLYEYLDNDLSLRDSMSKQYGIDFMSFKGAKIAELILVKECGYTGKAPSIPKFVKYTPPKYIKFKDPYLKSLFKKIKKHKFLVMNKDILMDLKNYDLEEDYTFFLDDLGKGKSSKPRHGKKQKKEVSDSGSVISPDFLDPIFTYDGIDYKFGIGGLHGSVEKTTLIPDEDEIIVDIDYKSLYPSIIIQNGFYPKHIGEIYIDVLAEMYRMRNEVLKPEMKKYKKGLDKYVELDRKQNTMKLVLNSSFGQTGQRYSKIYDPWAMLSTTLTGQLTLMMVIEKLSRKGFKTFYANTDGITLLINKKDLDDVQKITTQFDKETGLEMEYNYFRTSHIRDVNNFVNITSTDEVKSKGAFGEPNIEKNAQTPIVFEAVRKYLLDRALTGKSNIAIISDVIKSCKNVHDICSSRTVSGGAVFGNNIPEMYPEGWDESLVRNNRITKKMLELQSKMQGQWVLDNGYYLGKVVRWYYSKEGEAIYYQNSGNKVPMSEGAKPMMDLKKKIPKDIDYEWYINYAFRMLEDLGVEI